MALRNLVRHEDKIVSHFLWVLLTVWCLHCKIVFVTSTVSQLNNTQVDSKDFKETNGNNSENQKVNKTESETELDMKLQVAETTKSLLGVESARLIDSSVLSDHETVLDNPVNLNTFLAIHENLPTPLIPLSKDVRFKGSVTARVTTSKPNDDLFEEDDIKARKDWGGRCKNKHWDNCNNITTFGQDVFDELTGKKIGEQLDCANETLFPPVCLYNGWTVTRCHLICLAEECNPDLKIHYDKYVKNDGFC